MKTQKKTNVQYSLNLKPQKCFLSDANRSPEDENTA
jgi:hypothetical protein